MRFAFAGIDFLGGVFDELIRRGWQPVRLFTRPCDGIYDFNDEVTARARDLRIPIQSSRIRSGDLAVLKDLRCEALVVAGYPWLVTGWEPCVRAWGNPPCPCLHSDPQVPDCPPGESRRVRGWLSFYDGADIDAELRRVRGIAFPDQPK